MAIFKVAMVGVSVAAAQDLWSLKAGAANPILIHEIVLGQKTLTAVEAKELKLRRQITTVTQGSGGTTPTPIKVGHPGGQASNVTVHMNDTTASSAGTITDIHADTWSFLNGFFFLPPPEDRIYIDPGTAFIVNLPTAPSGAMTVYGTITYEELGL